MNNRLKEIKEWLSKSRVFLNRGYVSEGKSGEFYLLVAVEQLVRYIEVLNNQKQNN